MTCCRETKDSLGMSSETLACQRTHKVAQCWWFDGLKRSIKNLSSSLPWHTPSGNGIHSIPQKNPTTIGERRRPFYRVVKRMIWPWPLGLPAVSALHGETLLTQPRTCSFSSMPLTQGGWSLPTHLISPSQAQRPGEVPTRREDKTTRAAKVPTQPVVRHSETASTFAPTGTIRLFMFGIDCAILWK